MKFLTFLSIFVVTFISNSNCNTTTRRPRPHHRPSDINLQSISTGRGSYFEYSVRNIMQNMFFFPQVPTEPGITENEQMVYYYHLQLMHIDMLWLQNWMRENPGQIPDLNTLPSRAVRFHYNTDVPYVFEDGRQRTLLSHRLVCEECNRQFQCNVHHLHNHFPRIQLNNGNYLPVFVSSNDALNRTQLGQEGLEGCAAATGRYNMNPSSTTEDPLQPQFRRFDYHVELRRLRKSHNHHKKKVYH